MPAIDPGAEEALAEAFRSAGGAFTFASTTGGHPGVGSGGPAECNVVSAAGIQIAKVNFQGGPAAQEMPVIVSLPDGRVASVLTKNGSYGLAGAISGNPFRISHGMTLNMLWRMGDVIVTKGPQNEVLLSVEAPFYWWLWPFLLATFCMGACCVHCMTRNPLYLVKKNGQVVGRVDRVDALKRWTLCGRSETLYKAEDPEVLKGVLLTCVHMTWFGLHFGGGA